MAFSDFNLHSNIYKAIAQCGYTDPTPVQEKSIPVILEGKDIIVTAQTGTGKTASFVLPALQALSKLDRSKKAKVLILTPTRELANQITKAASLYGKHMRFNIVSLVGGMPYPRQIQDLARGADIIVATPGRLLDHIEQKRVDLSNIHMLVLDEADRMLDMGFIDDVQYISKLTPSERQTLLFSATLNQKLIRSVKHLLNNPVSINLSEQTIAAPQIKQRIIKADNYHHKIRLLKQILNEEQIFKAIIFSATKINASSLANQLCDEGFPAAALHGDLRQNVRTRTLEQLRKGKIQYLVATDVAARGIDVSDVTHVINFDLPKFCEDYVHRIGRTGRAGKLGCAISFVQPSDKRNLQAIERFMGQRIELMHYQSTNPAHALDEHDLPLKKAKIQPRANDSSSGRRYESKPKNFSGKKRSYQDSADKPNETGGKKRSYQGTKDKQNEDGGRKRSYHGTKDKQNEDGGRKRSYQGKPDKQQDERGGRRRSYQDTSNKQNEDGSRKRSYQSKADKPDESGGNRRRSTYQPIEKREERTSRPAKKPSRFSKPHSDQQRLSKPRRSPQPEVKNQQEEQPLLTLKRKKKRNNAKSRFND